MKFIGRGRRATQHDDGAGAGKHGKHGHGQADGDGEEGAQYQQRGERNWGYIRKQKLDRDEKVSQGSVDILLKTEKCISLS